MTASSTPTSTLTWISWFCSLPGHEYFCEVAEDFIEDDFNLTGLNTMVPFWKEAMEMVLDVEPGMFTFFLRVQVFCDLVRRGLFKNTRCFHRRSVCRTALRSRPSAFHSHSRRVTSDGLFLKSTYLHPYNVQDRSKNMKMARSAFVREFTVQDAMSSLPVVPTCQESTP